MAALVAATRGTQRCRQQPWWPPPLLPPQPPPLLSWPRSVSNKATIPNPTTIPINTHSGAPRCGRLVLCVDPWRTDGSLAREMNSEREGKYAEFSGYLLGSDDASLPSLTILHQPSEIENDWSDELGKAGKTLTRAGNVCQSLGQAREITSPCDRLRENLCENMFPRRALSSTRRYKSTRTEHAGWERSQILFHFPSPSSGFFASPPGDPRGSLGLLLAHHIRAGFWRSPTLPASLTPLHSQPLPFHRSTWRQKNANISVFSTELQYFASRGRDSKATLGRASGCLNVFFLKFPPAAQKKLFDEHLPEPVPT
ncbi:unnamed protein product [Notodromas monacha]|uniref:Uncharacterized protein n=1 Tax=Notodromas monacha TaxID=399045 RepID=A0A7R9GGC5_9CRUS|nr:unnamed protein product [Notodromas monacha]CAG0920063.1 unnamed protein product [Notodromas monacha]